MTTPERSLAQRHSALQTANAIRTKRARLKMDLKAGRAGIDMLILHPPEWLLTAQVSEMLMAVPRYGRVKVKYLLAHAMIAPSKTFGGLSDQQRMDIVRLVRSDLQRLAAWPRAASADSQAHGAAGARSSTVSRAA